MLLVPLHPKIPRQLLVDMHIRKKEEKAFNIAEILTGKNMISQALKVCWK
jgi:hypothetical protein